MAQIQKTGEVQSVSLAAPLDLAAAKTESLPTEQIRTLHIKGVDRLRIICAVWVVFSHAGGLPLVDLLANVGTPEPILRFVSSLNGIAFDGVAAVMVFFVISGLCIHLPVARTSRLDPVKFWIRRGLRVGAPLVVAVVLSKVLFGRSSILDPVLWSLYCELIYYAIYPVLLKAASVVGWHVVFAASVIASVLTVLLASNASGFLQDYGVKLTWIYGLPVWILGVLLAEFLGKPVPALSPIRIVGLRLIVWTTSSAATALHFHSSVHYNLSMLAFSPLAFYWVLQEIRAAEERGASRILEVCGRASYSVYLCHMIVLAAFTLTLHIETIQFLEVLLASTVFCAAFYFSIERPSHSLARNLAKRIPTLLWVT